MVVSYLGTSAPASYTTSLDANAAQDDLDGARQHYYAAIAQFEQAANLGMAAETRAELAAHLEAAGDLQGALLQMRLANQIALGTWSPSAEEQAEKSANQAG